MLMEPGQRHGSGVIHQHVHRAVSIDGKPDHSFDLLFDADVGFDVRSFAACFTNLLHDLLEQIVTTGRQNHLAAQLSRLLGGLLAKAAGGPSNDDDLPLDIVFCTIGIHSLHLPVK